MSRSISEKGRQRCRMTSRNACRQCIRQGLCAWPNTTALFPPTVKADTCIIAAVRFSYYGTLSVALMGARHLSPGRGQMPRPRVQLLFLPVCPLRPPTARLTESQIRNDNLSFAALEGPMIFVC